MKNTKYIIIAIAFLIIGLLIGKFIIGSTHTSNNENTHKNETVEEHWTCSMHPQIDMPEFGQCPICGMDLIPKESSNSEDEISVNSFKMTKNAMALANIQTLKIGGESMRAGGDVGTVQLSGKVVANDNASAIQTAHFGGRIERLKYKSVGEYVSKGSLIVSLYSPELVTAQNEFIEAIDIKNEQPELYKAVRNKLKNWKISEKQINQIEGTKKVITNFNMYANVSGYIDAIYVEEGNHVKEGAPLFKVSNLSSVWTVFDVYEQDIKNFKIGQQLTIKANAFPNKIFKAKIDFIDPILDTKTRTVQVRATVNNSKKLLKPGMLLTSTVKSSPNKLENKTILVPKTAVMWTGKRSVVYIKTNPDEPVFELREVELGSALGNNYQILSGVKNGEELVVNGTFTVDAAAQLQGKNSMMNKRIANNDDNEIKNEKLKVKNVERIGVNSEFKEQLSLVFKDYLKLKDAFVLTDAKKVSEITKTTLQDMAKVQMKLLKKPAAHEIWMPASKKIKAILKAMQNERDIENQRKLFITLSNEMIVLAKAFGTNKTIYVEHCPMANDNQGADWLSLEKEIKNPYFGDKMLTCGSVEDTIK